MIIDLRTMSLLQSKRAHAHVVPLQAPPLAILLVDSHRKAEWQPTRPRCWCPVLGPSELEPHGVRCATTSSFEESTTTPFVKPLFPGWSLTSDGGRSVVLFGMICVLRQAKSLSRRIPMVSSGPVREKVD